MLSHAEEAATVVEAFTASNPTSFTFDEVDYIGLVSLAPEQSLEMGESTYTPGTMRTLQVMAYQFGESTPPALLEFIAIYGKEHEIMELAEVRHPVTRAVLFYKFKLREQA